VGRETIEIGKVCTKRWAGKGGQGNDRNRENVHEKVGRERWAGKHSKQGTCARKGGQGNTQQRERIAQK
jgi:hypothetical protein